VGMLAMPTGGRHVQMREGVAGLAVQPRKAIVNLGTCLFAIVATDAQRLVDEQRISGLANALLDQELRRLAVHVDGATETGLPLLDKSVELAPRAHLDFELLPQIGVAPEQQAKRLAVQPNHLGAD